MAALRADAVARLAAAGVASPEVDADLILASVLGVGRGHVRAAAGVAVSATAAARVEAVVRRRAAREPLQLLLGAVGFRHLDLRVAPGVFIPRPESEVLAGEAIARIPADGIVVEPCTGTGAVAIAVAQEARPGRVVATDVSPEAVALARTNAARHGVTVEVLLGDLLGPVDPALRGRVDVLASNPPYLTPEELAATEPEVRDHDPAAALVAGPTGHEVSDRLIAAAGEWLAPGGWLLLEVDTTRARATADRAGAAGLRETAVVPDLTGRDRVVVARRPMGRPETGDY